MQSASSFLPVCSALALGTALTLAPATSSAQYQESGIHTGTIGAVINFSFGAHPAFGAGVDLRYMYYLTDRNYFTSPKDAIGLGAFAQVIWMRGGAERFTLGMHGQQIVLAGLAHLNGELGMSYRTTFDDGEPGGYALHVGFVPMASLYFFEHGPSFRGSLALSKDMRSEFMLGADIRGPSSLIYKQNDIFGSGRPLRTAPDAAPTRADLLVTGGRRRKLRDRARALDPRTRAALLAHRAREAQAECASIPAFLALGRDLSLAGAPSGLVRAAVTAAREEAAHTELCTALLNDVAPANLVAQAPPVPRNTDADVDALLKRLALESFWDGLLGEGAAAAQARRLRSSVHGARDEAARHALAVIAKDEQGHADLAAEVLAFCLAAGGKPVRDAVMESVERRRAAGDEAGAGEIDTQELDEDALHAHGAPTNEIVQAARQEAWENGARRLAWMS